MMILLDNTKADLAAPLAAGAVSCTVAAGAGAQFAAATGGNKIPATLVQRSGFMETKWENVYITAGGSDILTLERDVDGTGSLSFELPAIIDVRLTAAMLASMVLNQAALKQYIESTVLSLVTPKSTSTIGVGNATPAPTGAGITFPATQSPSGNANTLDDYKEGTFTPVLSATTGAFSSASATCAYTKVGRIVTLTLSVVITNKGTASGAIMATIPFTPSGYAIGVGRDVTLTGAAVTATAPGTNTVSLLKYDNTSMIADGLYIMANMKFHV